MVHVRDWSLVQSALSASDEGTPDADNARVHGVAIKTIRRWRRDYQRRGRPRGQSHTSALCPRCDGATLERSACAELLGWYLGDGYLSRGRRGVHNLKPGGRPHTRRLPGCLAITVSWKHWPCLFPQHGPGRKHDFLRGLFHSDGSRVANWTRRIVAGEMKRYDYPRWQFTNESADIRELCCWALDLADVQWRQSNRKTISVSTRAGVARLDSLIGHKY